MAEIDETTVFSLAPSASFQALGEGAVILMIDSGQLYTCNETTEAFLKLIDGQRNFGAILDVLVAEFAHRSRDAGPGFSADRRRTSIEGILEIRSGT